MYTPQEGLPHTFLPAHSSGRTARAKDSLAAKNKAREPAEGAHPEA